jgi:hypothetical protein
MASANRDDAGELERECELGERTSRGWHRASMSHPIKIDVLTGFYLIRNDSAELDAELKDVHSLGPKVC